MKTEWLMKNNRSTALDKPVKILFIFKEHKEPFQNIANKNTTNNNFKIQEEQQNKLVIFPFIGTIVIKTSCNFHIYKSSTVTKPFPDQRDQICLWKFSSNVFKIRISDQKAALVKTTHHQKGTFKQRLQLRHFIARSYFNAFLGIST